MDGAGRDLRRPRCLRYGLRLARAGRKLYRNHKYFCQTSNKHPARGRNDV